MSYCFIPFLKRNSQLLRARGISGGGASVSRLVWVTVAKGGGGGFFCFSRELLQMLSEREGGVFARG